MVFRYSFLVSILIFTFFEALQAIEGKQLHQVLEDTRPPFNYPLKLTIFPAQMSDAEVMVCFHGTGSDYQVANALRTNPAIKTHLVGFNFPDSGPSTYASGKTSYGTIQELLPALYVIKQCVVNGRLNAINLYGFSAGGGALVNTIAVLNTDRYDSQLKSIGILSQDKAKILEAIQNGYIILECPLKSIEEIIWKGSDTPLERKIASQYKQNDLRPIDSLKKWEGLKLNVLLYFQNPDEALSNRDDAHYVQNLQKANKLGKTRVVFGNEGGHTGYHSSLWDAFTNFSGVLLYN